MSAERPATYHAWLLLVKKHRLRLGPLEGVGECLVNHALHRMNAKVSYGFWDHQANSGFLDMAQGEAQLMAVTMREVRPAPAVADDDPGFF